MLEWGVAQGMHVMGTNTPYDFLHKCTTFNTRSASPLVDQDVLLMGGQEDHYIPPHQFFDQGKMLTVLPPVFGPDAMLVEGSVLQAVTEVERSETEVAAWAFRRAWEPHSVAPVACHRARCVV